jgi:outer membrane lipoprotein-sorting protein
MRNSIEKEMAWRSNPVFRISLGQILAGGFFFLLSLSAVAQYPGYRSIEDFPAFKKQFTAQSLTVSTITSNFTQEKILSELTEKIISKGKFWFKRSDKVRIEYREPFFFLMLVNGDKMLVRDDQKENKINIRSNKLFQQVNRIVIDCVQGTILDSKDFSVRVFENDRSVLIEMTPSTKGLREFFQTIVLTVEKKDHSVQSIKMNEPLGDTTTLFFTDKTLNEPISDAVFTL